MEDTHSYSEEKLARYKQSIESYSNHLRRCADILYQLETDESLSLHDKDLLKVELGDTLNQSKNESQDILDNLTTEFQAYDATSPRSNLNLSGFQMLKEKVVSKDKDYQLSSEEAADDSSFYYRE